MIVCLCNAVSERDIYQAASEGASTLQHLSERFDLGRSCGTCRECAADCLASAVDAIGENLRAVAGPR